MAAAGLLAGGTAVLVNRALAQSRVAEPAKATTPWRAEVKRVPKPLPVVANSITQLVEFEMAPFPYEGVVPATGKPFLDVTEEERRGHKGMRGQTFWEVKRGKYLVPITIEGLQNLPGPFLNEVWRTIRDASVPNETTSLPSP